MQTCTTSFRRALRVLNYHQSFLKQNCRQRFQNNIDDVQGMRENVINTIITLKTSL